MNMSDLQTILGLSYSVNSSTLSENKEMDYNSHGGFSRGCASVRSRRKNEVVTCSLFQGRGQE